jgi:hypothetical protein
LKGTTPAKITIPASNSISSEPSPTRATQVSATPSDGSSDGRASLLDSIRSGTVSTFSSLECAIAHSHSSSSR